MKKLEITDKLEYQIIFLIATEDGYIDSIFESMGDAMERLGEVKKQKKRTFHITENLLFKTDKKWR